MRSKAEARKKIFFENMLSCGSATNASAGAFKGGCEQTGGRFRCVSAPYCLRSLEVQKMVITLSEWDIIGDQ